MSTKNQQKKAGRPKKVAAVDLTRWTIIVPWETRIAVDKAAKRENRNLSDWINSALLKEAQGVLTAKREVAKPEDVMDVIKSMADRFEKMNDSLRMLEQASKPWWKRMGK